VNALSPESIGIIGIILMLILIFCRMWVGFAMFLVGFIGCGLIAGWGSIFNMAGTVGYAKMSDYSMSCIPMFVWMGCMLYHTGLGADIYAGFRAWLTKIKGGLAMATIGACAIFAAVCGDSTATAVTMGRISHTEMQKYGYDEKLSACCNSAGGTIGVMIPPSIPFIIYGLMTDVSIGRLFMAGIIPGVTQALFYIVTIWIWCKLKPEAGPTAPPIPIRQKFKLSVGILPIIIIMSIMLAGLYLGFFTPTEAGAFSAFATWVVSTSMRRMTKKAFSNSLRDALQTSCMVFFIILGAFLFSRFILISNIAQMAKNGILYLHDSKGVVPMGIVLVLVIFYLILGCFFDTLAALLLTTPIVFPIITALGLDPIWWGVIMVRVMETGMISPPFGLNLFTISKAINVPMGTLYRGIWPFVVSDVVHVFILALIPSLSTWLPSLM
jgi:tripartite ATP-independent transporter DctM subunit